MLNGGMLCWLAELPAASKAGLWNIGGVCLCYAMVGPTRMVEPCTNLCCLLRCVLHALCNYWVQIFKQSSILWGPCCALRLSVLQGAT